MDTTTVPTTASAAYVYLGPIWTLFSFIVTDILLPVVATVAVAWIGKVLHDRFGYDMDARNREALHSALETGSRAEVAKLGASIQDMKVNVGNTQVANVINWVVKSVPGALKYFNLNPSDPKLEQMAIAYLQKVLTGSSASASTSVSGPTSVSPL